MHQFQDQSQRMLPTAHLAQTMSLLVMSNLELRDRVKQELDQNPALELIDARSCPSCRRPLRHAGPCPQCSFSQSDDGPIVFLSPRDSLSFSSGKKSNIQDPPTDHEPAAPESLALHVLGQLAAELDPQDRPLAAYILSSLDDNGFLQDPPAYLIRATRASFSKIQHVLDLIARADPTGLATRGPREALLVQLELLQDQDQYTPLARQIVEHHFKAMAEKAYERIASQMEVSTDDVRRAILFIKDNLNPYPARAYWGSGRVPMQQDPNVYHAPDILITRNQSTDNETLIVEIFGPLSGWLRVNPLFKKAAQEQEGRKKESWDEHLERASLFVKCVQQRNNTMRRLMEILVRRQGDFIRHGDRHLNPMTRAEIAEEIEVHESTISRAVANKSVAIPDGRIIPLARFFDRSLPVRDRIKEIVRQEKQPMTDAQIVRLLDRDGVLIARRTVAKYRSIEGILPARLRRSRAASAP